MECRRLCGTNESPSGMESIVTDGLCCKTGPFDESSRVEVSMANAEEYSIQMSSFDIAVDYLPALLNLCTRSRQLTCDSLGRAVIPSLVVSLRCCNPLRDMRRSSTPDC